MNILAALVTRKAIGGVVRHLLGATGAALVTAGYLDAETVQGTDWQAIQGGAAALVAVGWSVLEKVGRV